MDKQDVTVPQEDPQARRSRVELAAQLHSAAARLEAGENIGVFLMKQEGEGNLTFSSHGLNPFVAHYFLIKAANTLVERLMQPQRSALELPPNAMPLPPGVFGGRRN